MKIVNVVGVILAICAAPVFASDALKPVKLMTVSSEPVILERQFIGRVAARQSVDLAFQVGGQIIEFPVIEGNMVAEGDMIAKLDQEQFEIQLEQALLQQEQAERTLDRMSKLLGNTVSEASVDDAETQVGLTGAAVRSAEWSLEHATLLAPFDGLISSRNVETFSTVAAGTPVVRIHDMSELRIEVDVPEILFQRSAENRENSVMARFPISDEEYPLMIREFDAETSTVGQTFRASFGMEPPEGLMVLPGSSATVIVRATLPHTGMVVPTTALVMSDQGDPGVMRFDATNATDGMVVWTPVQIEPTQTGDARITEGLEDGDEIVMAGGGALENGQMARRFAGFGN
ncbi:efflux RND transporter periplasmic adaptor subunit [Shimia sp. SDUM112013]|uniref:efflux RND transporter periplasmic adaptor subunit n=1 Tax=Shimia sp. SDUM112013 TaxID=3136160 RepID=UPI0032EDCF39